MTLHPIRLARLSIHISSRVSETIYPRETKYLRETKKTQSQLTRIYTSSSLEQTLKNSL